MIYACSVLQGYQATLGIFFLRLAFCIGILFVLPIPVDELKKFDIENPERLFAMQMIVHFICFVLGVARLYEHFIRRLEMLD